MQAAGARRGFTTRGFSPWFAGGLHRRATYWGEPVPTDVEVGPDGDLYVTSLPGGPELPMSGSLWRVDADTGATSLVTSGLTGAVDLAVAADGTVYVAELFADQVSIAGPSGVTPYVSVPQPGALEFGPDGTLYATVGVFGAGLLVAVNP